MTELLNSFENAVANGDPITQANSDNGTAGDAFDGVTATNVTADTDITLHGVRTALCSAPLAGDNAMVLWDGGSFTAVGEIWTRLYFRVSDTTPTTSFAVIDINFGTGLSATEIQVKTDGKLRLRVPTSERATSTVTLQADTWYRIETHTICRSSTQVAAECRLFYGSNLEGATPDETLGNINTNYSPYGDGTLAQVAFGICTSTGQDSVTASIDSVAFSDVGWIGPVSASPSAIGTATDTRDTVAGVATGVTGTGRQYWGMRAAIGDFVPGPSVSDILVPSVGAWFGGSIPDVSDDGIVGGSPSAPNAFGINVWESQTGHYPHITGLYKRNAFTAFTSSELAIFDPSPTKHSIPHVRWKPNTDSNLLWSQQAFSIVNNTTYSGVNYRTRVDDCAAALAAYPYRLFFTVEHEMDIDVGVKGNRPGRSPADFIDLWRAIYDRFATLGVTNVVWVVDYSGNSYQLGSPPGQRFVDCYPGDAYVDWIGWNPYINLTGRLGWGDLMFENQTNTPGWIGFYNWAQTNHPTKPLLIGETGVSVATVGAGLTEAQQKTIVASFLSDLTDYPAVRAVEYWHQALIQETDAVTGEVLSSFDFQFANFPTRPNRSCLSDWVNIMNLPWFDNDPNLAK